MFRNVDVLLYDFCHDWMLGVTLDKQWAQRSLQCRQLQPCSVAAVRDY
jgi:hypothetical protein